MNFAGILLLCLVLGVYGKEKSMSKNSGKLSSNAADAYRIIVGEGRRIVIAITDLKLGRGDTLTIRENRDQDGYLYKKVGTEIHEIMENDRSRSVPVTMPIIVETKTRTVYVESTGIEKRDRERFRGKYISYAEKGTCRKNELELMYDNATITCYTDKISPVADSCDVIFKCGKKRKQYGTRMFCKENNSEKMWNGLIQCQPKRNWIRKCSYNFDNFTVNEGCPFSDSEVAQFLLIVGGVVSGLPEAHGRTAGGKVVECGNTCSHNAQGAWTVNCNGRINKATYFRCLVCRVIYKCGRNVVIF